MPLFALTGVDYEPHRMKLRDSLRALHREYLRLSPVPIRLAAAYVDGEGNQCGSLLIFESASAQNIWNWIRAEPFFQAGVYEDIQVHEIKIGIGSLAD